MAVVQKLFHKYRRLTPPEALQIRTMKTLHSYPTGRFTQMYFHDVNPPTGTRKHATRRCMVCVERKDVQDIPGGKEVSNLRQ
jgi:hypothetical protein